MDAFVFSITEFLICHFVVGLVIFNEMKFISMIKCPTIKL